MKSSIFLLSLAIGLSAASAEAGLIDDFSGDLSAYTSTVILDANGGGSNTSAWQITGGGLELSTSVYDGIEQYAFIYSGLTLGVGEEVQADVVHNGGSQDIGLYVGGSTPVTGVREHYLNVYARTNGDVLSRGFTDVVSGEVSLKGGATMNGTFDTLFIKRDGVSDFELGYYDGGTRVVIADRNGITDNDGSVVGFYADVRAAGTVGVADNLRVIPEPATLALGGLSLVGFFVSRSRK